MLRACVGRVAIKRRGRAAARLTPRGFTLTELLVALGVGGAAFGAFALVVARQERVHGELARRIRARAQLRDGLTALVSDLRGVSPAAGDIPVGEARDSSIQFRATVGTAVVCEIRDRTVVTGLSSFVTPPGPGDTAWAYLARDGAAAWLPLPIGDAFTPGESEASRCLFPPGAASLFHRGRGPGTRYTLSLAEVPAAPIGGGTPLRVTRVVRYSLYRAPDSRWYLGRREWSAAHARFETVQPVSGPYRPYAAPAIGTSGLELRYFDAGDVELSGGSFETTRIAQITLTLRAPTTSVDDSSRERRDVGSLTLAVRNRP